jgi:hypothetical protein
MTILRLVNKNFEEIPMNTRTADTSITATTAQRAQRAQRANGKQFLAFSAKSWFIVSILGQLIFAFYVSISYGISGIQGDFDTWTRIFPNGYVPEAKLVNWSTFAHLLLAVLMILCSAIQFSQKNQNQGAQNSSSEWQTLPVFSGHHIYHRHGFNLDGGSRW